MTDSQPITDPADELEQLRAANVTRLNRLLAQGIKPDIPPNLVGLLVDTLFEGDEQLAFCVKFERMVSEIYDAIEHQVRLQALQAPPGWPIAPNGHLG